MSSSDILKCPVCHQPLDEKQRCRNARCRALRDKGRRSTLPTSASRRPTLGVHTNTFTNGEQATPETEPKHTDKDDDI